MDFAKLLAEMTADVNAGSQGGDVVFLKPGDYLLKLRMPEGRKANEDYFYEKYQSTYDNKQWTYFLVAGIVLSSTQEGGADPSSIKYIKLAKTAIQQIIKNLVAGWDLFSEAGPMIMLSIKKNADQTVYTVTMQPKQHDSSEATYPLSSIEDAAAETERQSQEYSKKNNKDLPFA